MEQTIVTLLKAGDRCVGAFGYDRERGRFRIFRAKAVILATGGLGRAFKITSNSWEGTGDGHSLGYHAGRGADRHGVHPVPSDGNGLAAERARHSRNRRRARRRRHPDEQGGPALYVRRNSRELPLANRRQRRGRLALLPGRQERAASARAADARSRGALHRPRDQVGPRQPARRRVSRHRVDQGSRRGRRRSHQAQAAEHVSPVQAAGGHRHHRGADGSRTDDALRDGRDPRRLRHTDVDGAGLVCRGRMRRRNQWRESPRREFALRSARLRQTRGRIRGEVLARELIRRDRYRSSSSRRRARLSHRSIAKKARVPSRCSATCRR